MRALQICGQSISRASLRALSLASSRALSRALRAGFVACVGSLVVSATLNAQTPNCAVTPATTVTPQDICRKVNDLFTFLAPQVGVALSGGNPMLGEGGTLGGPAHASLSVHATVVDGRVPANTVPVTLGSTAVSNDFGARRAPVPMPAVDAALGLFRGYTVGLTNVGGIDLLLGATYVPNLDKSRVRIKTDNGSFALAYGVRFGLLQESAIAPGISVSYRHRSLPTTSLLYTADNDTLAVSGLSMTSNSYRLTAAKRFVFIGIGGGIGRDVINATTRFSAVVNEPAPVGRSSLSIAATTQQVSRNTAFADVSFGLPMAQLTVEGGWSSKGEQRTTVNTFGGHSANEGYRYGSIGLGFRL